MMPERDRPLADRRSHAARYRFETDAMFVHRPDLDRRARTNTNPGAWSGLVKRPSELVLRKKQRQHSITTAGKVAKIRARTVGLGKKTLAAHNARRRVSATSIH
jgi:hypothetical protein